MDKLEQVRAKLIPGTPIPLGTAVYVCPALNITLLRTFKDELKLVQGGAQVSTAEGDQAKQDDFFRALCTVAAAALMRNYPDITLDTVEAGIDLNNVKEVTMAIMGASGFRTTTQDAAEEAVYGSPGESTGTA